MGNIQGALTHYRLYIFYRDSVNNEKNRKASIRNQLNYEFEKKEMLLNERNEKDRIVAKEKSFVQRIIIICAMGGLMVVIVFSIFIFRSLRTTRYQKHIIEEKQNEIIDSIKYAKRIQESLLPHEKYLSGSLDRLRKT